MSTALSIIEEFHNTCMSYLLFSLFMFLTAKFSQSIAIRYPLSYIYDDKIRK
jgi:hypothetical protein